MAKMMIPTVKIIPIDARDIIMTSVMLLADYTGDNVNVVTKGSEAKEAGINVTDEELWYRFKIKGLDKGNYLEPLTIETMRSTDSKNITYIWYNGNWYTEGKAWSDYDYSGFRYE